MEIPCPKCQSLATDAMRHELTQRETGQWKCAKCSHRWTPLEPARVHVDLKDRIEVLEALRRQVTGRLTAVSIPEGMLDMAKKLEQQACDLLMKANRIRQTLKDDTANVQVLLDEFELIELEIIACKTCQTHRIAPTKLMLKQMVEAYTTRKG